MRDETNFLTKEQYLKFIDTIPKLEMYHRIDPIKKPKLAPHELQLMFKVIYEGAFRVSEVIHLTKDDILQNDRVIKLESTKGNKKRGGKREFGTITDKTFDELVQYADNKKGALFPLTRQTVWKYAKCIGDLAGIQLIHENKDTKNMTIHTLRHSRAVHYVDAKQPINVVQKKLRHKSLQPTTTYLNINMSKIKEVENDI